MPRPAIAVRLRHRPLECGPCVGSIGLKNHRQPALAQRCRSIGSGYAETLHRRAGCANTRQCVCARCVRRCTHRTGCSGLAYTLEYVDSYTPQDGVTNFAQPDFVVLVDAKSLAYLQGLIVDWTRNGLNEGFEFRNPNERDKCGCGESFRV